MFFRMTFSAREMRLSFDSGEFKIRLDQQFPIEISLGVPTDEAPRIRSTYRCPLFVEGRRTQVASSAQCWNHFHVARSRMVTTQEADP